MLIWEVLLTLRTGSRLLVTGSPSAFGGIGKNCGEHPIANDFDTQAFIMDLATKKVQAITRDFNPTVSPVQWNRVDGCIYFDTTDGDWQAYLPLCSEDGRTLKCFA